MEEITYWSTRIQEDPDGAAAFVQGLFGQLDGPALGVARQFSDRGYDSLSDKQRWVLETQVLDTFGTKACSRCANPVPWPEMDDAYHHSGLCGWCLHQQRKMMEE